MIYALNQLLTANTLEAQLRVIQENPGLLDPNILTQLDEETKVLWNSDNLVAAEELWRVQRLLERVRESGIEATQQILTGSVGNDDENILLERSDMPLRIPYAVHQLLLALETSDVETVMLTLDTYAEALRTPTAPALLRQTGRYAQMYGEGSHHVWSMQRNC